MRLVGRLWSQINLRQNANMAPARTNDKPIAKDEKAGRKHCCDLDKRIQELEQKVTAVIKFGKPDRLSTKQLQKLGKDTQSASKIAAEIFGDIEALMVRLQGANKQLAETESLRQIFMAADIEDAEVSIEYYFQHFYIVNSSYKAV